MVMIDEMIVEALTHGSGLQLSMLAGADERSEKVQLAVNGMLTLLSIGHIISYTIYSPFTTHSLYFP